MKKLSSFFADHSSGLILNFFFYNFLCFNILTHRPIFKTFFYSNFTLNTFIPPSQFLSISPKPLDSHNICFATFLISFVILSHVSFTLPWEFLKSPYKILSLKISFFTLQMPPRDIWRPFLTYFLCSPLDSYIYNQYYVRYSSSHGINLQSKQIFLSNFLTRKKSKACISNSKINSWQKNIWWIYPPLLLLRYHTHHTLLKAAWYTIHIH